MESELNNKYQIRNNFKPMGSSALCLDIRNSTKLIRQYSQLHQLKFHAGFLIKIKRLIFNEGIAGKYCVTDTGDGMMCLFWNNYHAWSAFRLGIAIRNLILKDRDIYNNFLKENGINDEFKFGIGLHSGSSLVYKSLKNNQEFMYGAVLNTTARLESFTKIYKNVDLLFTGYFKTALSTQLLNFNDSERISKKLKITELRQCIEQISKEKVDISDWKNTGHTLWTVKENISELLMV